MISPLPARTALWPTGWKILIQHLILNALLGVWLPIWEHNPSYAFNQRTVSVMTCFRQRGSLTSRPFTAPGERLTLLYNLRQT